MEIPITAQHIIFTISVLPFVIDYLIRSFLIVFTQRKILLFHQQLMLIFFRLIRGDDYASLRKTMITNSKYYKSQGLYTFMGCILIIISLSALVVDSLTN